MKNNKRLKNFGINVKIARLQADLSQEELAERADISRNSISLIETGKLNPTILKAVDISRALEVSLESLVEKI